MLGGFGIEFEGNPLLDLGGQRPQLFLSYLLLHRDRAIARQEIAFLFWPEVTESQARTNFRNLLHRLRRLFPEIERYVWTDNARIGWKKEQPLCFDVERFEQSCTDGETLLRRGETVRAISMFSQAAESYTGDLLLGTYDEWIVPIREKLRGDFFRSMENLLQLFEERREYDQAIHISQRWLREDPLSETAYAQLMRLQALKGDRVGALRTYHACASMLQRDLGMEPSEEIRLLYQRLIQQEEHPPSEILSKNANIPLVGRDASWQQLQSLWKSIRAGKFPPQLVLIHGESGIGSTRLAEEFINWIQRQGFVCALSHAFPSEGELAYGPVVEWLRALPYSKLADVWRVEISRLLPDLLVERPDLASPGPISESWQRQRFHEALARTILDRPQPLLLFVDDVQWADQETLAFVHFLLRYDLQAKFLVLATASMENPAFDKFWHGLVSAIRPHGQFLGIPLARLDATDTAALVNRIVQGSIDSTPVDWIYSQTEGIPLFVVELAQTNLEREGLTFTSFPNRMREVLERRINQLSPKSR
jgi:DNA-binding SARP family transcriptional activator